MGNMHMRHSQYEVENPNERGRAKMINDDHIYPVQGSKKGIKNEAFLKVNGLVYDRKTHISWENLWFPVDFPLNQSIEKRVALMWHSNAGRGWQRVKRLSAVSRYHTTAAAPPEVPARCRDFSVKGTISIAKHVILIDINDINYILVILKL